MESFYVLPERKGVRSSLYTESSTGAVISAMSERDAARMACERFGWLSARVRPWFGKHASWRVYSETGWFVGEAAVLR